jgi:ABC-type enterochelin transport system permease subunit
LFVIHLLFTLVFGLFCNKRKFGRVIFIPLLEIMMCGVMLFFNGRVDLVLTFSPTTIAAFAAVMATIWKDIPQDRKDKFNLKWLTSKAME